MPLMHHLRRTWAAARQRVLAVIGAFDLRDVHAYGGVLLVSYGLHQVHPPLSFIVAGLALFWLGVRR